MRRPAPEVCALYVLESYEGIEIIGVLSSISRCQMPRGLTWVFCRAELFHLNSRIPFGGGLHPDWACVAVPHAGEAS